MRQLVYIEPGRIERQEAADPELTASTSAVVEPLAVARCDLELPMASRGLFRFDPLAVPTTTCRWDEAPQAWLEPAIKLVVTR